MSYATVDVSASEAHPGQACQPPNRNAVTIAAELALRGSAWVLGSGTSMAPTIRDGDRIFVRRVPLQSVRRGDVVLFRSSGTLVLHRVQHIVPDCHLDTLGDSKLEPERRIPLDEVLGVAMFSERRGAPIALRLTLKRGVRALARGCVLRARVALARVWRRRLLVLNLAR